MSEASPAISGEFFGPGIMQWCTFHARLSSSIVPYCRFSHATKSGRVSSRISKSKDGWTLGVHIADVSHYVQPGNALPIF